MKRLVWLLIAVVCTALAQVQPVVVASAQEETCCCTGEAAGACGMPDCAPAPSAPSCTQNLPTAAAQRSEVRKPAPASKVRYEIFRIRFDIRPAAVPAGCVSLRGTPAASVPLFKAHCRFLI
ncbi:MAG: hypothetical protein QG602_1431 [Verrucomicrobiota bacterium]|nr:hypothetical protein [Verrucomicrobiota bacterium]